MTKKYLITFGGTEQGKNRHNESYGIHRDYSAEAQRLFSSANGFGFESFFVYDNGWIPTTEEYKRDSRVFLEPSFGWAFKPLSIWHFMQRCNTGDVVFWVDSNHIFLNSPQKIIEYTFQNQIFTHDHSPTYYPNSCWTHRDMFLNMGCDSEKYWNAPQMQVNILCFLVNDFTKQFVEEWKDYACDYNTMIKNELKNFPCYIDHRHEQSIFSILREKYNLPYAPPPEGLFQELMGINIAS
jgi:hypothetical protein